MLAYIAVVLVIQGLAINFKAFALRTSPALLEELETLLMLCLCLGILPLSPADAHWVPTVTLMYSLVCVGLSTDTGNNPSRHTSKTERRQLHRWSLVVRVLVLVFWELPCWGDTRDTAKAGTKSSETHL